MVTPRRYPRGSQVNESVRILLQDGVLMNRPRQVNRSDLSFSDGIDIIYDLKGMTPDKFGRYIDLLLSAASYEANRYSDYQQFHGSWTVRLNTGSRTRSAENERNYTAASSTDIDTFIWGDSRDTPKELGGEGKSLSHKGEAILGMLQSGSPGAYINQQSPYRVLRMIISVRSPVGSLIEIEEQQPGFQRVRRPGDP
jgi:hypothetical protein